MTEAAAIKSVRRFYLLKRQAALEAGDEALSLVWRAKQEAEAGEALPAGFPCLSSLAEHGYSTEQDLNGANSDELLELGFSGRQVTAILAALAPLL